MGEAGRTSYLFAVYSRGACVRQGKGDVTLHVVGTTYKSWAMLGITRILFLQYVHCEGYANFKYAIYTFCAGIQYPTMQCA